MHLQQILSYCLLFFLFCFLYFFLTFTFCDFCVPIKLSEGFSLLSRYELLLHEHSLFYFNIFYVFIRLSILILIIISIIMIIFVIVFVVVIAIIISSFAFDFNFDFSSFCHSVLSLDISNIIKF